MNVRVTSLETKMDQVINFETTKKSQIGFSMKTFMESLILAQDERWRRA
jgi:hypothetical protein